MDSGLVHIDDPLTRHLDGLDLTDPASGPKRVARSLRARREPLASPAVQLERIEGAAGGAPDFLTTVQAQGAAASLRPLSLGIFQVNLGKLCNMTCRHCHVDAGPDRHDEVMDRATVDACLAALDQTTAHTVDLTGGAPELNPQFEYLVEACVARGKHVIDRCNLTILRAPRFRHLPAWLAERGVEVVCSLPHPRARNTDAQRGDGTFEKSIAALRDLNAVGYGQGDPKRRLTLMSNPAGAFLAGDQAPMERQWKASLKREHGIDFDRLICLNNMPISRFLEWLEETGNTEAYLQRLTAAFNPAAVAGLMCRDTLSVSWDGRLFDCDFNQMLDLELQFGADAGGVARPARVEHFDPEAWRQRRIVTARHCYGCTAGNGSSCGGATA